MISLAPSSNTKARALGGTLEILWKGDFFMYTVKEVAQMLDLTEHTVRYYTDRELVPSVQRKKYSTTSRSTGL
jgi:hypothetical protein